MHLNDLLSVNESSRSRRRWWRSGGMLIGCGVVLSAGLLALWGFWPRRAPPASEPPVTPPAPVIVPAHSDLERMVFPTDQDLLGEKGREGVFMPTNPDHPESALFGSVRTAASRSGEIASFHEGVDIAPVRRDRRGRPLDEVHAIADGQVGYINRAPGNSNYGCYIVLLHNDPVGQVFSLYAHLASVRDDLRAGQAVTAGLTLGIMGNTSTARIPMTRAHVHLEMGLISNARFRQWFKDQKLKPDHGSYNGWNLLGVDPLAVFEAQRRTGPFTFRDFLSAAPASFDLAVKVHKCPDFFSRYPGLWSGAPYGGGAIVLRCSENGLPVSGRNAAAADAARLGAAGAAVLSVDEAALGRNGSHIIGRSGGGWIPASGSKRWLDILTY